MDISKNKIKNVIFDLGGVIINIDYSLLTGAFSEIGLPGFEKHFSQLKQKDLFDLYEKGLISSQNFRDELKKHCKIGTTDTEIDTAWNAMLLDLPKERLELILNVKNKYRTFLLSNTNEIHMLFIYDYLKKKFQIPDFNGHFEKVYLSYEVHMRKPDAEIFDLVIGQNGLLKEETLFIDDSVQHIESAKIVGIQTYLLDVKKESIISLF
jgi:epoxide hydrolase-like predicted phosphatase